MKIFKNQMVTISFKIGIVVALLYFLAQKGFLSLEATQRALTQWQYILPAVLLMGVSTFLGLYRWHILLRAAGIHLKLKRSLELGFVGCFFNIALPGAVSGDVVKAIYVGREAPGKRAWALSSILFDRVAGVSALVLLSAVALGIGSFGGEFGNLFETLKWFVMLTGCGVVAFFTYLFLVGEKVDPLLAFFKRLERWNKKLGSFLRIYEGLRNYHHHRGPVAWVLFISLTIHIFVVLACLNFSWALGIHQIPWIAVYAIVPLGLLVTAIPIAPAGTGTGHAAFAYLFGLLGTQRGGDVFSLYVLYMLAVGAVGGLVYLRFRSSESVAQPATAPASE